MKNTISHIAKNASYAEQYAILQHLEKSLTDVLAEIEGLDAKLEALKAPDGSPGNVAEVLAMLSGKTQAKPGRDEALVQKTNAENKAYLVRQAIEQQRSALVALVSALSSEAGSTMRGEHAEAVRAIANALKSLDVALAAEESVRGKVVQAGYRCVLPAFAIPEMGRLNQPQSRMDNLYRDTSNYAIDYDDHVSGNLDKPAVVHLLADAPGIGHATEVVVLAGRLARQLVRMGRAEETSAKPRRVVKQDSTMEVVFG